MKDPRNFTKIQPLLFEPLPFVLFKLPVIKMQLHQFFVILSNSTAISVEDGTNQESSQEQIYENIRLHKEVIQSVKLQPWSMRKKLKLVRQVS